MRLDPLRVAAFCVYLAAWLVLAVAALVGVIPRRGQAAVPISITVSGMIGTLVQVSSALVIVVPLGDAALQPSRLEMLGVLLCAPVAAAIFVWALRSSSHQRDASRLVTSGAYARLRHPIYLAFLAMLLATGLIVSAGVRLVFAIILYLAGTELRIAGEENELEREHPGRYARYRQQTRWRYLPGLR